MLSQTLPKTLNLLGVRVRSQAITTLGTVSRLTSGPPHRVKGHTNRGVTGVIGCRCLSYGGSRGSKDPGDFSQDPQVKEWMKELEKDFNHKSEEGMKEGKEEEEMAARRKEEERDDIEDDREKGIEEEKAVKSATQKAWSQLVAEKYKKLDTHSQIIYDYDEERLRREEGLREEEEEERKREKMQLERGETGVFDVEELVDLLREDNARDVVVIQIPPELKYASYMVIVSSASQRHRTALAELVRAAYKLKKDKKDPSVLTEGKGTKWVAMDMGNIILHIMEPETREMYDLETLWAVGAEYDEQSQISEEDLVTVRRPRDPLARPPPSPSIQAPPQEAVT